MSAPAGADAASAAAWIEESRAWCEVALDALLPPSDASPSRLHAAMRYALFGGGKRLRPALVRLVCRALGGSDADARAPAAALELVHTYSLVHDDLPCMDDDDLRRGRPTCHVVFGEALAVLVGDALLTRAFGALGDSGHARAGELASVLARAAGSTGMVGGQVQDLASSEPDAPPPGPAAVAEIHGRKTAALFAAASEMGALAAGADGVRDLARRHGDTLGLLFQAVDDVLDVVGDAATLGKTPGKDARLERGTLVAALGLDGARAEAERLAQAARLSARELAAAGRGRGGDGGAGLALAGLVELLLARRA